MRIFVVACIVAAVVATGAAVVLYRFQEPVAVAFTTSAARI
jgi:Na+-driven multidrug efflux pump